MTFPQSSLSADDQKKLKALKNSERQKQQLALKKRLKTDPYITDLEFLLGAFIEMYEPHLYEVVKKLSTKGYMIEPTSGLGETYVALDGYFTLDYTSRNTLEKKGVKIRDTGGMRSLYFLDKRFDLNAITEKWLEVAAVLPDKSTMTKPSSSSNALEFRRKYTSKNPHLQRQRLFEKLEYNVLTSVQKNVALRKKKNPKAKPIELHLGVFLEELEPQVKNAVIEMNKKGYATDRSGFANKIDEQMIEGDFTLLAKDIEKLQKMGVHIESNPTGYTKIEFAPKKADITSIKNEWKKITGVLQSKKPMSDQTMTKRARDFRIQYA